MTLVALGIMRTRRLGRGGVPVEIYVHVPVLVRSTGGYFKMYSRNQAAGLRVCLIYFFKKILPGYVLPVPVRSSQYSISRVITVGYT
eukprot:SAG31_NODE_447_length_15579_cov_5.713871_6_plen_87_part_00